MRLLPSILCLLLVLHCSYAPPVTHDKDDKEHDSEVKDELVMVICVFHIIFVADLMHIRHLVHFLNNQVYLIKYVCNIKHNTGKHLIAFKVVE